MKAQRWNVDRWTVDYGDGKEPCTVPHAWRQDHDVRDEGPVVYRVKLNLPPQPAHLLFHGVSYACEVKVNGEVRATHRGIWDSFEVGLGELAGTQVDLEVTVVKNGGPTYPTPHVASGFIPYVFNTFGGIFREVELVLESTSHPRDMPTERRHWVVGRTILVDDQPFYPRGLLHWGWYPELGHPNPPDEAIRRELQKARDLGFNLVKFCLWLPPHRYLEIMREYKMEAWIELPIWLPSSEPARLEQIADEVEAVVRQYRHHDNVLAWSVGCELGKAAPAEYRARLYGLVKNLTGSPLVVDSSGGAEMYGGDAREFGDFSDFHPYCDLQYFPAVFDCLAPGARVPRPTLLGEFNDVDIHRDLARIHDEMPYWASSMAEMNHQGCRWLHDLPNLISSSRFVHDLDAHRPLMRSSVEKAAFQRKTVQEGVRSRPELSGYVVTGWRDTPMSTSGLFDDWGNSRFDRHEILQWNSPDALFLIPSRRPPWTDGGNRPGIVDPHNVFTGPAFWRVGVHTESGIEGGLIWSIRDSEGKRVSSGTGEMQSIEGGAAIEVGEINWDATPGDYRLEVEFGNATNSWPITVVSPLDVVKLVDWSLEDLRGLFPELLLTGFKRRLVTGLPASFESSGLVFLVDEATVAAPFWRESAYEFGDDAFWAAVPFREAWPRLLPVSPDRVVDVEALMKKLPEGSTIETLMNRVDARNYNEAPILARVKTPSGGTWLITTLRPFGGLGAEPPSFGANPSGAALLEALVGTFA